MSNTENKNEIIIPDHNYYLDNHNNKWEFNNVEFSKLGIFILTNEKYGNVPFFDNGESITFIHQTKITQRISPITHPEYFL